MIHKSYRFDKAPGRVSRRAPTGGAMRRPFNGIKIVLWYTNHTVSIKPLGGSWEGDDGRRNASIGPPIQSAMSRSQPTRDAHCGAIRTPRTWQIQSHSFSRSRNSRSSSRASFITPDSRCANSVSTRITRLRPSGYSHRGFATARRQFFTLLQYF